MALGLRVFSIIFTLLLFSCATINNSSVKESKSRSIILKQHNSADLLDNRELTTKIPTKTISTLIPGSISTIELFASDLWVGTLGGALFRYNLHTKTSKQFLDETYSIRDYSIKKILDIGQEIIVLQSDRVLQLSKKSEKIKTTKFPNDITRATDIVMYKNKIYISTLGFGLWEYSVSNNSFSELIPYIKFISSLKIVDNILYIGSMKNGLYQYNLLERKVLSRLKYPLPLFRKNILEIDSLDSEIWLGTAKNGLIIWDPYTNKTKRLLPDKTVSSICLQRTIKSVSFIGYGVYIRTLTNDFVKSINTDLKTNNVTSVAIFEDKIITGNIKKGVIIQDIEEVK